VDVATFYFNVQAGAVALWWLMLYAAPSSRAWFFPAGKLEDPLLAFVIPDLVVLSAGSALAALLRHRRRSSARWAAWFVSGAVWYAASYTVAWAVLLDAPLLSVALMLAAAFGSVYCAAIRV